MPGKGAGQNLRETKRYKSVRPLARSLARSSSPGLQRAGRPIESPALELPAMGVE